MVLALRITRRLLVEERACERALAWFEETHGSVVVITSEAQALRATEVLSSLDIRLLGAILRMPSMLFFPEGAALMLSDALRKRRVRALWNNRESVERAGVLMEVDDGE